MYHQESLIAGNATRALHCTKVSDWHISSNSLVFLTSYDRGSEISICDLKSNSGVSTKTFDVEALDPHNLDPRQVGINHVLIAPDGELLVHLSCLEMSPTESKKVSPCLNRVEKLVKLSRGKDITWQITFNVVLNRPVVSEDAIYFVRDGQQPPSRLTKPAFCKVNLKDGKIIYETSLSSDLEVGIPHYNTSLRLMADKSMAIWNDLDDKIHIFSTASGRVLYTFDQTTNADLVLSNAENKFWIIDRYEGSIIGTYDKETSIFMLQALEIRPSRFNEPWCIDGDRPMICSLIHETSMPYHQYPWTRDDLHATGTDPFTMMGIAAGHESVQEYLCRPNYPQSTYVTLPPRSAKEKERRHLEAELPWSVHDGDFFGMCEDYVVFHDWSNKTFLLVDFWPPW